VPPARMALTGRGLPRDEFSRSVSEPYASTKRDAINQGIRNGQASTPFKAKSIRAGRVQRGGRGRRHSPNTARYFPMARIGGLIQNRTRLPEEERGVEAIHTSPTPRQATMNSSDQKRATEQVPRDAAEGISRHYNSSKFNCMQRRCQNRHRRSYAYSNADGSR
jgi:hypothetical protein